MNIYTRQNPYYGMNSQRHGNTKSTNTKMSKSQTQEMNDHMNSMKELSMKNHIDQSNYELFRHILMRHTIRMKTNQKHADKIL